jgi:hypothetical protein
MINSDLLKSDFSNLCEGKSNCDFDITKYLIINETSDCLSELSQLYGQYNCDFSDELRTRQLTGLLVAMIATICGLFFVLSVEWLIIKSNYDY